MSEIDEVDLGMRVENAAVPLKFTNRAMRQAKRALSLVSASLPWLSPLAYAIKLIPDPRFPVAAVTASGQVYFNPELFTKLPISDAAFVLAHELMHIALDTFSRQSEFDDPKIVNIAHDYIINDLLTKELGRQPPLQGLFREGASKRSLEELVLELQKIAKAQSLLSPLGAALKEAGIEVPTSQLTAVQMPFPTAVVLDVIPKELAGKLSPEAQPNSEGSVQEIRTMAQTCVALKTASEHQNSRLRGTNPGEMTQFVEAIRDLYQTPWQMALQRWLESVSPGGRTWARPSRRAGDRADCVLPGRLREGWTLHVVLDTSGSMTHELPHVLGALAQFCENARVSDVHILQCDTEVTVDEWIACEELANYEIHGYGGSDMSPAMLRLADDPEVAAMVVITDGCIAYPRHAPPVEVLWVVTNEHFQPAYGTRVYLQFPHHFPDF